LKKLKVS